MCFQASPWRNNVVNEKNMEKVVVCGGMDEKGDGDMVLQRWVERVKSKKGMEGGWNGVRDGAARMCRKGGGQRGRRLVGV